LRAARGQRTTPILKGGASLLPIGLKQLLATGGVIVGLLASIT
jgi:hypothetical protein